MWDNYWEITLSEIHFIKFKNLYPIGCTIWVVLVRAIVILNTAIFTFFLPLPPLF